MRAEMRCMRTWLCCTFWAVSPLIMLRFEKFKNWLVARSKEQIFACRKYSRIRGYSRNSRKFPAREYFLLYSMLVPLRKDAFSSFLSVYIITTPVHRIKTLLSKFHFVIMEMNHTLNIWRISFIFLRLTVHLSMRNRFPMDEISMCVNYECVLVFFCLTVSLLPGKAK